MDPDQTKQITDFLSELAKQLGEAGTQAFQVVGQRVVAEAIIWTTLGVILLLVSIILGPLSIWKGYHMEPIKNYGDDDPGFYLLVFGLVLIILGPLCAAIAIIPSVINLLSPQYATLERLLRLVHG